MKLAGLVLTICAVLGVWCFDLSVIIGILAGMLGLALVLVPWILAKRSGGRNAAVGAGVLIGITGLVFMMFSGDLGEITAIRKEVQKIDKLLEKGQGMEVLTLLEKLPEEIDVKIEAIAVRYSQAYQLIGDIENAQNSTYWIHDEEKNAAYYLNKMVLELKQEQYQKAMNTMQEAAAIFPYNEDIQFNAGFLCFMRGDYMSADFYLQRLYEMDIERNDLLYTLGAVKFSLGEYEKCESIFAEALKKDLDDQMRKDILDILASIPYREG